MRRKNGQMLQRRHSGGSTLELSRGISARSFGSASSSSSLVGQASNRQPHPQIHGQSYEPSFPGDSLPKRRNSLKNSSDGPVESAAMASTRTAALIVSELDLGSQSEESVTKLGINSGRQRKSGKKSNRSKIYDDPAVVAGYASVPLIELDQLPRGGISFETKAVGRIQFGIPPETIKDSMRLGFGVPSIYMVPVERFCREMGPALGINLSEFEFPAYFNYFVRCKRCALLVDSPDAESNIRRVFGETLLGPGIFRDHSTKKPNEDEDFDPSFPTEARPNFYKEFYHFRTAEESSNYEELTIDMLLDFVHFKGAQSPGSSPFTHENLGVPPPPPDFANVNGVVQPSDRNDDHSKPQLNRRHTTQLSINSESDEDDFGGHSSNQSLLSDLVEFAEFGPVGDAASHGREVGKMPLVSFPAGCRGPDCKGCYVCQVRCNGKDGASEGEHSSGINQPPPRRRMSDPDVRSTGLSELISGAAPRTSVSAKSVGAEPKMKAKKRGSVDSMVSNASAGFNKSRDGMSWASGASFMLESDDEDDCRNWMYSQAKWLGEVATIYPDSASEEEKASNRTARVEIFKMTGGTEYIIHDVDKNNIIIGKARFSGTVRVPDEIALDGFSTNRVDADVKDGLGEDDSVDDPERTSDAHRQDVEIHIPQTVVPPTFHPPSFGVTVLGNSHGFDKNGSVSGYVLWINGRGVMIDPPPYASATLEREGIRSRMIIAIMVTHCHADHDAGTFQKVMTGSRVAVITTPTIYKSFIRKYAALSGLSPALLRHSHRHRPAIIGQPLKFQGATFHFTYTLHTIPCIAFRVNWRGRSMVFTGDHLNSPPMIDSLEKKGVLTKERADDLRRLPLQECDLLLHEAGAPPIHTPLDVLKALPERVKKRLYVVHTSALPADCELRVAPTGTAGTIRLDQVTTRSHENPEPCFSSLVGKTSSAEDMNDSGEITSMNFPSKCDSPSFPAQNLTAMSTATTVPSEKIPASSLDDGGHPSLSVAGDYIAPLRSSSVNKGENSVGGSGSSLKVPPLVFLRPTCVSDAWFILNLLSAVPFLSSLSYANTMEVLEISQVEVFCANEVVIPAHRRTELLCVVWEGTCIEQEPGGPASDRDELLGSHGAQATPPPCDLPTEFEDGNVDYGSADDVAMYRQDSPTVWHAGDWTGPISLQPEYALSGNYTHRGERKDIVAVSSQGVKVITISMKDLHRILKNGSKLYRKYLTMQEKQEAEEAAMKAHMLRTEDISSDASNNHGEMSGPDNFPALDKGRREWFVHDNLLEVIKFNSALRKLSALQKRHLESLAEGPRYFERGKFIWQVGAPVEYAFLIVSGTAAFAQSPKRKMVMSRRGSTGSMIPFERPSKIGSQNCPVVQDKQLFVSPSSEYARLEVGLQLRVEEVETDAFDHQKDLLPREERMRNARDRFANKVLGRLYARKAYTSGLVFSRGHFLSDTSRMVSGSLAFIEKGDTPDNMDDSVHSHGEHHCHSSNITAGPDGCAVMVFPRASLISFLDAYPGVLLSLLGTQIVV